MSRSSQRSSADTAIGLIAGNGRLPFLFVEGARAQGLSVITVAHRGETDPALASQVDALEWIRVGQVNRIIQAFRRAQVRRAVMAGGIGRIRALTEARPDWGAVRIISRVQSFRDDGLLRAIARYFEEQGIEIVSVAPFVEKALAPEGVIAGPALSDVQQRDVALGIQVAHALGAADVGQSVVVKAGHVMALEAIEGTDETIRRGGKLGGRGAVVVKLAKPQQDDRFDLPAVGPRTIEVMAEVGGSVLAVEAGRTLLLESDLLIQQARARGISIVGVVPARR